ncbi:hypothetical protein RRF57_003456 [Xylaria bambusicola]|uniref:Uncharacterized protein n=1 Tax=Xylaria bambusicola TaxID=326684 RepID=A0AAN7Z7M5_9PEZI
MEELEITVSHGQASIRQTQGFSYELPAGFPIPKYVGPSEVLSQAKPMAQTIFKNWNLLRTIVERHESTIQRRWIKKSRPKRQHLLLATWPNMSGQHRSDVAAWKKKKTGISVYEACMWPAINLEDLLSMEPLLLLLNSRGRNPPDVFAMADIEATRFGVTSRTLEMPLFLNEYSMAFTGRRSPETYGELISWDDEPDACYWTVKRSVVHPGEGLRILEIQSRLYQFLVDIVRAILHDMSLESLTDPTLPVQPEPPTISANSKTSALLATVKLESSYRLPARLDISRLKSFIESKLSEAEDHFWALREDPAYFTMNIQEWKEHRQEELTDLDGYPHSIHQSGSEDFWNRVIGNTTLTALQQVEVWNILLQKAAHLAELQTRKYPDDGLKFEEDLPPDYAMAFHKLHNHLVHFQKFPIDLLKTGWVASPPMRPYWRRRPPPDATSNKIAAIYLGNIKKGGPEAEMLWILQTLFDDEQTFLVGLSVLIDEFERLMKNPAASGLVSAWVADKISHLSVLSECLRQLELF